MKFSIKESCNQKIILHNTFADDIVFYFSFNTFNPHFFRSNNFIKAKFVFYFIANLRNTSEKSENISANNPKLLELSDNGGAVPTMALPSDSPAIGLGRTESIFSDCIPPGTDARGKPRNSPCSAGAFEYQFPSNYEIWAEENLRGLDTSPAAALCGDGLTNLQKYAQAVSSSEIDSTLAPLLSPRSAPIELCTAPGGVPTLKFRKNKYMDSSVRITPLCSTDMATWIPLETALLDSSLPDADIFQAAPAGVSGERVFFKLEIEKTLD